MASASYLYVDRLNPIPLPLPSLCTRLRYLSSSQSLTLHRPSSNLFRTHKPSARLAQLGFPAHWRPITAVAQAEPDRLRQTNAQKDNLVPLEPRQKVNQFRNGIVFGLSIGITVGGVVLAGGWVFTAALATAVFAGAPEYFKLVQSRGITAGLTPPPCYVSRICSVICALMPMFMMYRGHTDVSVTSAAFVVAMALLLQRGNPTFAQLSSAIFGLFYCGYLPCIWVKLQ